MRKINSSNLLTKSIAMGLTLSLCLSSGVQAAEDNLLTGESTASVEESVSMTEAPTETVSPAEVPESTPDTTPEVAAEDAPEAETPVTEPIVEPEAVVEAEVVDPNGSTEVSADTASEDTILVEEIAALAVNSSSDPESSTDNADFDGIIVDGRPASERLLTGTTNSGARVMADGTMRLNSVGTGKNAEYNFSYDASYIWGVEKKNYTFKARIPYWFMNAFPKAGFTIAKGKTKVSIPIYNTNGKKVLTKTVTLNTDSQLWLGNYADDDNYVCPPWLAKAFNNAVVEGTSSTDSACLITYLPVYKNAKQLKAGKWILARKIEYYYSGKYRITTVTPTAENPGGNYEIGF